jgi:hypothetical protein
MRYKMPQQEQTRGAGEYLCLTCESRIMHTAGPICCVTCGNSAQEDLVPLYIEDDADEQDMYSDADWSGGD